MDAYFDIFSGISGNMVLGALIDLGLQQEELEKELEKLGISSEYEINVEKVSKQGIGGTYVNVKLIDDNQHKHNQGKHSSDHEHNLNENDNHIHGHNHSHSSEQLHQHTDDADSHQYEGHNHSHKHDHDHQQDQHDEDHEHIHNETHNHSHASRDEEEQQHEHHHHGRNLSDINHIIDNSNLSDIVKYRSKEIFLKLAQAEAKIHGKDVNEIHFHEVGAVDAIVDIVGAVIGLELLDINRIYASRIHTGTGFVNCDHGQMPVPAPATMELLKGIPVYSTGIESELVTPTGAAIITTLAQKFGPRPGMEIANTGYGAGGYELEIPNLLRINTGKIKDGAINSNNSQKKKR